ncbi:MAG TPA: hypothetical protein VFQ37_13935 [Mycobacterium sp.]|nr:hypothetical protein [Mycobacterium sp.]
MTTLDNKISKPTTGETKSASVPYSLPRDWTWTNWALALLTAPAAVLVMTFALGAVTGTALCSSAACPDLGPDGSLFNLLYYGAPVVAGLTLFLSFFTATQRRGVIVSLCGCGLLVADLAVLAIIF